MFVYHSSNHKISVSLVNSHGHSVRFVVHVEAARAHDLFVNEGGLARRASAVRVVVVYFVNAETFSGNKQSLRFK